MKKFDLNIEKVLEDWDKYHALREIIANALDEKALTKTHEINIFQDKDCLWHIRDFGRGLKYEHLTQNENEEKLRNPDKVIGKFGVGLKDALATLDRKDVHVLIKSKFGEICLGKSTKHGFDDITTLHAFISEPSDPNFVGTEFILRGLTKKDIELAKDFFLIFSDETLLEETYYGQVLKRGKSKARIYINGVRVAEEENFLFSYNITSLTGKMRKALNRERTNVGRIAYTDRVKSILLECKNKEVAELIVTDLKKFETGRCHDELNWLDVSVRACKLLNSLDKVIFLTSFELINAKEMVDRAISDGFKVVTIPQSVKEKIQGLKDIKGNLIRDLKEFQHEWNDSFEFDFVYFKDLTENEKNIYKHTENIFNLIGGRPITIKKILISNTMRLDGFHEAVGVWEKSNNRIIIKRSQLKNLQLYAGTLLHEVAHAKSDASDISREFEGELSDLLGIISSNALNKK